MWRVFWAVLAAVLAVSPAASLKHEARPIGPVTDTNFADPSVVWDDDSKLWYAFATRNRRLPYNVQVATSPDFVTWSVLQMDALPDVGAWVQQGGVDRANVWAPDVLRRPDGRYVLYYSGQMPHSGKHCVGAALSRGTSPSGPYDANPEPLACPLGRGGAIDISGYRDVDGVIYTVYKIDGNSMGHGGMCGNMKKPRMPTPIMLQRMDDSGLYPVGEPVQLLNRILSDGPLIEAPSLVEINGTYVLFFSSGCFVAPSYNVNYATSSNITGPYARAAKPLLSTGMFGLGAPGGMDIDITGTHLVFHGWRRGVSGIDRTFRVMYVAYTRLVDGVMTLVAKEG